MRSSSCAPPHEFDVIVTDNMFGDILSDEAAVLAGSLGVLPSASLGPGPGPLRADPRLRARHRGARASPTRWARSSTIALMLEHVFRRTQMARAVEKAMVAALREVRTPDIGGHATTTELTDAVLRNLSWSRWSTDTEEEAVSAEWGV